MNRVAGRAKFALLLVLALFGGMVFFCYEYLTGAEQWVLFSGSPHVYTNGRLQSGTMTDRNGELLVDISDERTYSADEMLRKAVLHWTGDRFGNIRMPAVTHYAEQMVGYDPVNGVYSYGNTTGQMRLTLDARVQKAAREAMGDQVGTVAVYNYKTGELLCAVTTPSYDPDNVPDINGDTTGAYVGVYMNRFIQSNYTPGSVFKIVTLAAALEAVPDIRDRSFTCSGEYEIDSGDVTCEYEHGKQSLQDAFANSCNCAFAQLVQIVGSEKLDRYVRQFGVVNPVKFDGITTVSGNFDISGATGELIAWSGIGQHTDLINPCAFMTFVGAIANGGSGCLPHVVSEITVGREVTYEAEPLKLGRIMSQATAQVLQQYLQNNVEVKYGTEHFPGLTVCAKTGTAEVGGDRKPNALFTGFVANSQYPYAFIAVVENGGYGSKVCIPVVSAVLEACKTVKNG